MGILIANYSAPCGKMILGDYDGKLCLCDWGSSPHIEANVRKITKMYGSDMRYGDSLLITETKLQLDEYFSGKRKVFNLPLLPVGTEFQKKVWDVLLSIPYGETISYGEEARRLGKPGSVRAVASANGRNSISIIIPCHRVIGANGTLTGYAGGLDIKRCLLDLEMRVVQGGVI